MAASSVWNSVHAPSPGFGGDGWDLFLTNPRDPRDGKLYSPRTRPSGEDGQVWDHSFRDAPAGMTIGYRSSKER